MSDPLSQFRRKQTPASTESKPEVSVKRAYHAFDTADKPASYTEIRCILQPSQSLQSRFLMAVVFSSDYDDAFTLIYSFLAVEIRGQHLKDVKRAIQNGRCEFIQEYHENEFVKPPKDAPVIDSVKFITGEKLDDILSAYRGGK
jgi:hypothetical protein